MDDFVRNKLTEWGLSKWIERFEDEEIEEESFYCLDDQEIDNLIPKLGPRAKFKKKLMLLKKKQNATNQETGDSSAQCQQEHEEAADSDQESNIFVHPRVRPSTRGINDKGKRKLDPQDEPRKLPAKRRLGSYSEKGILSDVENIMRYVHKRLPNRDNKLNKFLRDKIEHLKTDKRELVGVFGKTGAGKSSLINAIIEKKNLLPAGSISACTSVMIKVEANRQSPKYEAEIEFITKEEWKDELWSLLNFLRDNGDEVNDQDDEDYRDTVEKLSALYGEECKNKTTEQLMDMKYFREIPEFLQSKTKKLTCESAQELSAKFVKYTRSDSKDRDGKGVKKWYWPLVKCVTVRVPDNGLLQHVTLVDLPGSGDRNKSRDEMWKKVVGSCSTVWIVTDIDRAASEKEPWEILESASSIMGNGGECQHIHFICTKSDHIEDSDDHLAAGVPALIFKRNMQAQEEVKQEFNKLAKVKKHFSDDCFKVFTVSSKEFLKKKHLNPDETEIPKLQEFLQTLNDDHSQTLNYVSGAQGILSLIQGASCRDVAERKADLCRDLEENLSHELYKVRKPIEETCKAFEQCLSEGVEKSKKSCEGALKSVIHPRGVAGRGFHRTLKCVVENGGTYKPKKKKEININAKLASYLTDSIDEEFKKTFPNERKRGPFNGVIDTFSLDTMKLIEKYKDVELLLTFLKSEEDKMKTELNKIIRDCKKSIYSSLTTTIEKTMQECYKKAAGFNGQDVLKNMRDTIENHIRDSRDTMFVQAKDTMLGQLRNLKEFILKTLEETMQKAIDLSLKTDGDSVPDVTVELAEVKKYLKELLETETPLCPEVDPPGPAAALQP